MNKPLLVDKIGQFVAVPFSLAHAGYLSGNAKAVFLLLRSYPSSNDTGVAFPSYDTIATACGFASYATTAKCLRELESTGWISRVKRFGATTVYSLHIGAQSASPTKNVVLQKVKDSPTESEGQSYRKCRRIRVSVSKNETHSEIDARTSVSSAPSEPATPKTPTAQQVNWQWITGTCVGNYSASRIGKISSLLASAAATDEQRAKFTRWWPTFWKSRNGQAPTPEDVWQQWPVAQAWNGAPKQSTRDNDADAISQAYRDRYAFASDLAFGKKMEADTNGN